MTTPFSTPYAAASAVLVIAALLTLAVGLARRAERRSFGPGALFVALGSLAFFAPTPAWRWVMAIAAGLAWLTCVAFRPALDRSGAGSESSGAALAYAFVAFGIALVIVFYDLGGFADILMVWETGVVDGFHRAFTHRTPASAFAAEQLFWNSAVLSEGNASLLYGAPTYALMTTFGFSTAMLRLVSALAALSTIGVLYAIGRRFFGGGAGAAIAAAASLHSCVLFYGRYGTSLAATLLAVTALLLAAAVFLDDDRSAWWTGVSVAVLAYLATVGYATGRIVVLLVLGWVAGVSLARLPRLNRRRALGLFLLAAGVAAIWQMQRTRHYAFLEVRGEQFLAMAAHPETYAVEFGERVEQIETKHRVALARKMVAGTLPHYLARVLPDAEADRIPVFEDQEGMQRLYHAPLVVLLLLGVAVSLRSRPRWLHLGLFAWALGVSGAILLTTGADSHRLAVLVVPICIWIGLGAAEGARMMAAAGVPRLLRHATAILLLLSLVAALRHQLYRARPVDLTRIDTVLGAVERASGPVVLAGGFDAMELGTVVLDLLERARRDPAVNATLLHPVLFHAAAAEGVPVPGVVPETELESILDLARERTLIFAPAARFRPVVAPLEQRGVPVIEEGPESFRILRTASPR